MNADGAAGPVEVTLRTGDSEGGKLAFRTASADDEAEELTLSLPETGEPVGLVVSGKFRANLALSRRRSAA